MLDWVKSPYAEKKQEACNTSYTYSATIGALMIPAISLGKHVTGGSNGKVR